MIYSLFNAEVFALLCVVSGSGEMPFSPNHSKRYVNVSHNLLCVSHPTLGVSTCPSTETNYGKAVGCVKDTIQCMQIYVHAVSSQQYLRRIHYCYTDSEKPPGQIRRGVAMVARKRRRLP